MTGPASADTVAASEAMLRAQAHDSLRPKPEDGDGGVRPTATRLQSGARRPTLSDRHPTRDLHSARAAVRRVRYS